LDLAWVRPLDLETLNSEISHTKNFIILDESYIDSGVTGYILPKLERRLLSGYLKTYALPPEIIPHGDRNEILNKYNLTPNAISQEIFNILKETKL
jgi:1-deoxy-D-xylulose-5-phosphate synthase